MNFSEAVRGTISTSRKLQVIHSSWETEFGSKMTEADQANLSKLFSLDETHGNVQKVMFVLRLHPNQEYLILVWIWSSEVPANDFQKSFTQM